MNRTHSRLVLLLLTALLTLSALSAQNTLQVFGSNEAQFIYRTAPDSLNAYFQDVFSFNIAYRNVRFGLKYIAELPRFSNNESELIEDLSSDRLSSEWKEFYASYEQDKFLIHAGTITETFGSGINFRSWEDLELDEDNRIDGFLLKYDGKAKFKALYGSIASPADESRSDLAYGADLQYPLHPWFSLGASAVAYRTFYSQFFDYNQQDVFGERVLINIGEFEGNAEYSIGKLYKFPGFGQEGSAIHANASYNLYPFQFGSAYKKYDQFYFRLQDLPMANNHSEPLSEEQSGADEEGLQGWLNWQILEDLSTSVDYAEAWNRKKDKKMNDLFTTLDYNIGNSFFGIEFSHIEKADDEHFSWQLERTPGFNAGFPFFGHILTLKSEYKYIEKKKIQDVTSHYEPKLQADYSLGKLSLSGSVKSHWTEPKELKSSVYWTNLEARYRLFEHTDMTIFAGRDAGGKVCRNGTCRYVSPFQGLKLELNTRF